MKKQSLRSVSLKILVLLSLALSGLLFFLQWGIHENRKLAEKYIYDTANLYVEQINKDIFQINSELIVFVNKNERVTALPASLKPQDARHYELIKLLMEQNNILKIRYDEVQFFYTYGYSANVLITDAGTVFYNSIKTELFQKMMDYLYENSVSDSLTPQWILIQADDRNYIFSWYAKNKKAMGCVIEVDTVFKILQEVTESYEVLPIMRYEDGIILMSADAKKKYGENLPDASRGDSRSYSFQLGSLGQIVLYVLPDDGILENLFYMQMFFIVLVLVLLILCGWMIYSYYQRVMEPMKRFVRGLEEISEEQMLNENGTNNLLELEAVSDKFRELLRKIQSLKIAIYEKELMKQKAELEYMQEQIKPHFYLNCLSLIHGIADAAGETEIQYITEVLSDYMRYIFKESGQQRSIRDEIDHVSLYAEIQKLRYGEEAFTFEVIQDGEVDECQIPSLMLQTLVENSIVHGVTMEHRIDISLYTTFESYEEGDYLYICVSDTGKGFTEEILEAIENGVPIEYNGRKHVGLQNIRHRLNLLYGTGAVIEFSNMDKGYGAVVEIRIPKEAVEKK